jgi:hypothetical protein
MLHWALATSNKQQATSNKQQATGVGSQKPEARWQLAVGR